MRTGTATALRPSTAVLGLALLLATVGASRVPQDLGDLEKPAVREGLRSASVVAYGDINSVSGASWWRDTSSRAEHFMRTCTVESLGSKPYRRGDSAAGRNFNS
jgi:hypothetical protein